MLEKKAPLFGWIIKFSLDRVWRSKVWWVMVGGRNFILSDLKTKTANLMCSPVVMWQPLQLAANTFYFPQTFCFSFSSQLFYFFFPHFSYILLRRISFGHCSWQRVARRRKTRTTGTRGGSPASGWVAVGYRNESGTNFATLWGMQPGPRSSAVVICRLMPFWQNNFSYYCSSAALLGLKIAYKFSVAYFAAAAVESATRSSAPCQVLWPGQATGTQLGANCQKGILEVTECDRKISGKTSICNNTTALGEKWPAIIIAKIVELDNVLCFSIWTKF